MFALTALAILAASGAQASVLPRQVSSSAPWCEQLKNLCVRDIQGGDNIGYVFAHESCVLGSVCYPDVDQFIAAVQAVNTSIPAPQSCCIPRVTDAVFNAISSDDKLITQQNFIDGFYSTLTPSNGPWPNDVSQVIGYFNKIAEWTGFCSGGIPRQNFGDYFRYASSNPAHVCTVGGAITWSDTVYTTSAVGTTDTVYTTGAVGTTDTVYTTSAVLTSDTVYTTSSVATATTIFTTPAPTYTPPTISSDATCQKMFTTCASQVKADATDAWSHPACVYGATCFGGQRPVSSFLATVWGARNQGRGSGSAPAPANIPRVPQAWFNQIAPSGQLSQQNWIDGWYSFLDTVGGPYPPNPSLVISYFDRITGWTNFCSNRQVPYFNFADYYQWSATVQGGCSA